MSEARAVRLYSDLLGSIGTRATEIGPRPLVNHWPHIGSAYNGLLIVGQALRGWEDEWHAPDAQTPDGRARVLAAARARGASREEPLDWVPTHPKVKNSPFWIFSRHLVEALVPGEGQWYARYAWANLYPVAPEDPPDNPTGVLKAAQDPFVGPLLIELADMLQATRVIVIAGPAYWYHARRTGQLTNLGPMEKPLLWRGTAYRRQWLVGYHPKWASFQGWGAPTYAAMAAEALARRESQRNGRRRGFVDDS